MIHRIKIIIITLFHFSLLQSQSVVFDEIMSANISTIADEDGDFSDWIELYNADTARIILHHFGLSDDRALPFRWTFPDMSLEAGGFLFLFASGKDIREIPIHWETIIDWGDEWNYLVPQTEPPSNWTSLEFDDTDWLIGPSGFGYGDHDDSTDVGSPLPYIPSPISVFVRKKFTIHHVEDIINAILHVDYDDGFVAYLNDTEIARANLGLRGTRPKYDQFADQFQEARMYRGEMPEKFDIENVQSILQAGENVLALQIHNADLYSSDLTLIPFLTLATKSIPPAPRGPSPHLQFPASSKMHTNFKIKATGETLILSDASGQMIDKVQTGYIPADVSWGRQPDGGANWLFFDEPTPGMNNTTHGYKEFANTPQFSPESGFYTNKLLLEISATTPDAVIHYTTDGSIPDETSPEYEFPILIDSTTVVRARVLGDNLFPGKTQTHTYFIDQQFTIPIISLATDPANFWDNEIGIYVFGDSADTVNYPYWGSNFWQDWERPIHIEFFEPDGKLGFSLDAGVQIFGSWSRLYPQKALAIFARGRYGYNAIDYQIFPDKPIHQFQAIILRNSGQDWGRTFFRDAMMHYLVKDQTDLDIQAYRPAMVFLNGELWGIHNVREKMNEHYLASNRGVDPENIDFIERDSMIIKGDTEHYQRLLNYVQNHDMQLPASYDYVKTQMDVDNFIDYTLSVIYFANPDWPWNNVKCWRPKTPTGKWKWLLFDLDYGFHGGHLGPDANVFHEMRNQDNGTTRLFFSLLKNAEHRANFINRFADHLNTTFNPSRVVQVISWFKSGIEPAMPFHIKKWKNTFQGPWWLGNSIDSMEEWDSHIEVLYDFAHRRADYVRQHIIEEFQLMDGGIGTIHLNVSPNEAGEIKVNSLIIDEYPWQGQYFVEIPIRLTAIPQPGFRFSHWNGAIGDSSSIRFQLKNNQFITAVFEPDSTETAIEADPQQLLSNTLHQNYPNPFNSQTIIQFKISRTERVSLKIFNILGDEIRLLMNEKISAGNYQIVWDGCDNNKISLNSGIYFFKLETDSFNQVRKMILIR